MTECRDCKTVLDSAASKCHHCGSFQNWRRYFGAGSLLAGFVLTWVSIWAAPPVQELLDAKRANIEVSILNGDFMQVQFMLANTGNRPAGLAEIQIDSDYEGGSGTWFLRSELDNQLIAPGEAHVVVATNGSLIPQPVSHEDKAAWRRLNLPTEDKECELVVKYIQLNGTKEYLVYPFLCDRIDAKKAEKEFVEFRKAKDSQ